ncbi:MAG TPA: hypothetical protein VFE62_26595, partial [Gemmataceae bacterium]|nr:hypothetical protein [Gemmataceae bacterium]
CSSLVTCHSSLIMLEHATLLLHEWKADGAAWARSITDGAGQPLGCVRLESDPRTFWFSWLRRVKLDIFETDDASHLMTMTRSWSMLGIWEVEDAEARAVGTIYACSIVSSEGHRLALVERANPAIRLLNELDQVLATVSNKGPVEITFAPGEANPFLRMLLLGYAIAQTPLPSR